VRSAPVASRILGATRILAGTLFACHGVKLLFGVFGGRDPAAPVLTRWVAGPIELLGGVLLAAGLFTTSVAFVSSGLMAVAYFMEHAPRGFWPIRNGGELAILYCFVFLNLVAQGPGAWALGPRSRRREPKRS
jgi:putative oxidoreductase